MVIAPQEFIQHPTHTSAWLKTYSSACLRHLLFAAIRQQLWCLFELHPLGARYLDPHVLRNVIDPTRLIPQQIEADDFEHPLPISPRAYIHVFDVSEFGDERSRDSCLFADLPECCLEGLFPRIDQSLGQTCDHLVLRTSGALFRGRAPELGLLAAQLPPSTTRLPCSEPPRHRLRSRAPYCPQVSRNTGASSPVCSPDGNVTRVCNQGVVTNRWHNRALTASCGNMASYLASRP